METFTSTFLEETVAIVEKLDHDQIERLATGLAAVRDAGGRLFILGVGGSAGHAGHAVNDFRKICRLEAYTPTDNVSELTARVNDDGWDTTFSEWLKGSRLRPDDAVLVFSVGGRCRVGRGLCGDIHSRASRSGERRTGWGCSRAILPFRPSPSGATLAATTCGLPRQTSTTLGTAARTGKSARCRSARRARSSESTPTSASLSRPRSGGPAGLSSPSHKNQCSQLLARSRTCQLAAFSADQAWRRVRYPKGT